MEWFVIFLALGVAIGPMLYLMPTDRDRHIAGLRALAEQMGAQRVHLGGRTLSVDTALTTVLAQAL